MIYIIHLILAVLIFPTEGINLKENSIKTRDEITIIYIGSSNCGICTDTSNAEAFNSIYEKLISANKGFEFKIIGISLDNSPESGYKLLNSISKQFDEMIIGGKETNLGAIRYLQNKFKSKKFIPQVLILNRKYNQVDVNSNFIDTSLAEEVLLYRLVGLDNILKFASYAEKIDLEKTLYDQSK